MHKAVLTAGKVTLHVQIAGNQAAALTMPRSVLTATAMRNSELPPKDTRLLSVRRACRAGLANPFSCSTAGRSASVWDAAALHVLPQ